MENKKVNELKTFEVGMWWYELHGGTVKVEAKDQEEAQKIVDENFDKYMAELKKLGDTITDIEEKGFDQPEEVVVLETFKDEVYVDRFNTDVYVKGTTGHYFDGNILELGRVIYKDYTNERSPYQFTEPNSYQEQYNYYNLGACSNRNRESIMFNQGDFRKLFSKMLSKKTSEMNYDFASNLNDDSIFDKHIITLHMNKGADATKPRTVDIRATKVINHSYRVPCRIDCSTYKINFSSKEAFIDAISSNSIVKGVNNEEVIMFLNTPTHINQLEKVVESIIL